MFTVAVEERHLWLARQLMADRPVYRGSHRGEAANEVGCLGEAVVLHALHDFGIPVRPVFQTTHDMELASGWTVEVKTKDRTVAPQAHFDCSIPDYVADHQHADFYVFVSLQRDRQHIAGMERFHTAHIVGVGSPRLVQRRGRLMEAGTTDTNGTRFWTSCRNIAVAHLVPLADAVTLWTAPNGARSAR